jgi:hypothetical protein
MRARTTRTPFYIAGLTAILAAAMAGCASANSGSSAGGSTQSSASPTEAVKLAAKTTGDANSFTGTFSVQGTVKGSAAGNGALSMTASMTEQLHPLLAQMQISSMSMGGQSMPGGLGEILTPSTFYLESSIITQQLHTSKPWISVPVSTLSKSSGINLTQLFSQASSDSPLTDSQLLQAASGVRQVGTSTLGGVPVTEYEGTVPLAKGMQELTGSTKTAVQQQLKANGLTTASFKVWVDGSHMLRKAIITEDGTELTEVITMTINSINQPVNIQIPTADQTTPIPASALGGAS